MSRQYAQATIPVFEFSGSLAAGAAASGAACCLGYSRLVGGIFTDASAAANGFRIDQSTDLGTNWDFVTASNSLAACGVSTCNSTIIGNAIRVRITNGATSTASNVRARFYLLPI